MCTCLLLSAHPKDVTSPIKAYIKQKSPDLKATSLDVASPIKAYIKQKSPNLKATSLDEGKF